MAPFKITLLVIATAGTAFVTACASTPHRACDASEARHRQLAAEEERKAEEHTWHGPVQTSPTREHQERAEQHRDRAERHEQYAEERAALGDTACAPE